MGAALSSMLATPTSLLTVAVLAAVAWVVVKILSQSKVPRIFVDTSYITEKQRESKTNRYIYFPRGEGSAGDRVQCYDPATLHYLGFSPALKPSDVKEHVARARQAQQQWAHSSFEQRRQFLRVLLRYVVENQDLICRVSARESGKVLVDAGFGEILTTCEKIAWLLSEGERWLKPEYRSVGRTMLHKTARVEFEPAGVIGAIVPWNYPFHNVLNPVLSAVFSGNAAVIKVSEHASWGAHYYLDIIRTALKAVGAPPELVHVVTGFGSTGSALVQSGVDRLIFVGSTAVGRKVLEASAVNLTPTVLELGGKDAFIVCDDADLTQVVPIALRAVFQCSGQNCIGAERFFVHAGIYEQFVGEVVSVARQMRLGYPLADELVEEGRDEMSGGEEVPLLQQQQQQKQQQQQQQQELQEGTGEGGANKGGKDRARIEGKGEGGGSDSGGGRAAEGEKRGGVGGDSGSTSAEGVADMGAICMPHHVQRLQRLVDDAVAQGAKVLVGGRIPLGSCEDLSCSPREGVSGGGAFGEAVSEARGEDPGSTGASAVAAGGEGPVAAAAAAALGLPLASSSSCRPSLGGQFYPPTILVNVRPAMRILHEEVFGPIMCIVKVESDDEAIAAANDCPFGLGCSVFSGDRRRATAIGSAVKCGMVALNDFGSTYMCQSLPFGGVKESGFGRFAGVEGLRGCCNEKAVVEDRFFSLIKTNIPPPLQYPLAPNAVPFQQALVRMFFAHTLLAQLSGLFHLLLELLRSPRRPPSQTFVAAGTAGSAAPQKTNERPHIE
ncbi:hypothetical protein CLOM_g5005 [Closterium sp. NIES-68]|nr:hypothetical protein CLOM_g5005 [Closterium sp. NIES-68]GJP67817.1 hypothetical protein CLOP_g24586 [Closterium sp. NIES-67]